MQSSKSNSKFWPQFSFFEFCLLSTHFIAYLIKTNFLNIVSGLLVDVLGADNGKKWKGLDSSRVMFVPWAPFIVSGDVVNIVSRVWSAICLTLKQLSKRTEMNQTLKVLITLHWPEREPRGTSFKLSCKQTDIKH